MNKQFLCFSPFFKAVFDVISYYRAENTYVVSFLIYSRYQVILDFISKIISDVLLEIGPPFVMVMMIKGGQLTFQ